MPSEDRDILKVVVTAILFKLDSAGYYPKSCCGQDDGSYQLKHIKQVLIQDNHAVTNISSNIRIIENK